MERNKDEYSKKGYLAWMIIKGNGYKDYTGLVVDKICNHDTKERYKNTLFAKMNELIVLLD